MTSRCKLTMNTLKLELRIFLTTKGNKFCDKRSVSKMPKNEISHKSPCKFKIWVAVITKEEIQ